MQEQKKTESEGQVEKTMATVVPAETAGESAETPVASKETGESATPVATRKLPGGEHGGDLSQGRAAELTAGQVIGKCRIERELGRGGMGAVYLARHLTLDVPVAVKILPPTIAERDPQFAERFMREAKLACRIKHANVISVMDADHDQKTGLYMIVQEFVDGGTIRDLIRKGPLPEAQALDIVAGVAEALTAAAEFGIVHRDIKPDNIMLTRKGVVKLADLGIAKESAEQEAGLTMSHVMMGTPAYMAPEQANDAKTVDARADIYSLGATLYHMLCGSAPYSGDTAYAVLSKLATAPTPDPREKIPGISDGVAKLVMRMMEKDREKRPQSAAELLDEIKALRDPGSSITDLQAMARDLLSEMRAIRGTTGVGTGVGTGVVAARSGGGMRKTMAAAAILVVLLVAAALAAWHFRGGLSPVDRKVETAAAPLPVAAAEPTATAEPTGGDEAVAALTGALPVELPPVVERQPEPVAPTHDLEALRGEVDAMLRKALDEETMAQDDVRSLFDNPVRFVSTRGDRIDPALVVRELVERRVQIDDVFAILGKPRVGIDIAETVVGKDGLSARDSRLDRFRTALRNEMEQKYGLFIVDVTGDRADQKSQCDILITGDIETVYFNEAVPPELAAVGGTTPLIAYNTAVKVRFINAVTNQDLDSSIMDFEPRGREDYCGMSHGDAIRKSIAGAIDTVLPDWMNRIENTWVRLRTHEEVALAQ